MPCEVQLPAIFTFSRFSEPQKIQLGLKMMWSPEPERLIRRETSSDVSEVLAADVIWQVSS